MAITRTPIIDDSGDGRSGTVIDNAWKQELYNQIDAAGITSAPAAWAPGVSGIGNVGTGLYVASGKLVFVSASMQWPANAVATAARFTLPFGVHATMAAGFYVGYGPNFYRLFAIAGTNLCDVVNGTTGAAITNQALASVSWYVHGSYLIA